MSVPTHSGQPRVGKDYIVRSIPEMGLRLADSRLAQIRVLAQAAHSLLEQKMES
jgi:hypothetical protein